ncbi:hypothetical protein C8Q72DRAFT_795404 [Fomitopsis betulina]|nr:hypothetical protein C8Q72DRAFT_795404 [Fomitopsis betulina]
MCYHLIGRIYLAANLSESDNEDIQPPPPPPLPRTKGIPQRSRTEARTGNAEGLFDDDGEDEQYERGEEEDDGEDLENHEACVDFNAEQVTFTSPGAHLNSETANGRSAGCSSGRVQRPRSQTQSSHLSSVASSHPTEPPGTDHDDFDMHEQDSTQQADDNCDDSDSGPTRSAYAKARTQRHVVNTSSGDGLDDMVEKEIVVPVPPRQLTKKQKTKLKEEAPSIRLSTKRGKKKSPVEHTASDSEDDGLPWLPRTNLNEVDAKGMDIKPQNGVIKQVMRHVFAIGNRMIVFGSQDLAQTNGRPDFDMLNSMSTPMDKVLLDKIALAALVSAAENLGYGDNDYNVADRLERGSYRHYIKPITTYVAHRLGLFRTAIKKAVTSSVEHVYDLVHVTAGTPAPTCAKLLEDMNYIYPWDSKDGFNRRAPYENAVIKLALCAAFFTQQQYLCVGLQNSTLFKSSTDTSTEIEIPADMLALTMTAVEAVLSDHNLNLTKSDFGTTSAPAYRAHMVHLADFRHSLPWRYHHVMHELFKAAT